MLKNNIEERKKDSKACPNPRRKARTQNWQIQREHIS